MFNMPGIAEWIIIFLVALLIFGPNKLPEIGRSLGKAIREFRKSTREIVEDSPDKEDDEDIDKEKGKGN